MKRLVVFVVLVFLAAAGRAEVQNWELVDGSTVSVMKVLSQNATHVTVRSPEGIQQIDKRRLPQELAALYPYDEAAAGAQAAADESAKARLARAVDGRVAQGAAKHRPSTAQGGATLEILSLRPAGRATAIVSFANRTGDTQEIRREALVGVNANGARFAVSRFTNERGDLLTKIRLMPNATKDVTVVFDIPEGEVGDIGSVYWNR